MNKSKNLLFITPNHLGFYEVLLEGIKKYTDYNVTLLLLTDEHHRDYKYKHFGEKILNFFLKTFFNENLKKKEIHKKQKKVINTLKTYDLLFVLRPDMLDKKITKLATKKSKHSMTYYWDSFEKIKGQKETIKYYNTCYTFDSEDAKKYNIKEFYNFYYQSETILNPEYKVHYIGTYDNRYNQLIKILDYLQSKKIKSGANLFTIFDDIKKEKTTNQITFLDKIIPFKEVYKILQNTEIILDLKHENQKGLSFRVFDAIGMRKKLITTNENVKNFDFYNPNNIFVWEKNTFEIPNSFFETPYEDLPLPTYEKYSLKNWINTIIK